MQPDELEPPGRKHALRSLRLEIPLLHEPGGERGTGERERENGCNEELSHWTTRVRGWQTASSVARKTAARR